MDRARRTSPTSPPPYFTKYTNSSLGGTNYVQGVHSRGTGGDFVHVELEQSIRFDAGNRTLAATAIGEAMVFSLSAPGALPLFAATAIFIALRRKRVR